MGSNLNDYFLWLFCEENSDRTMQLVLRGREVERRSGKRLQDDDMQNVAKFINSNPRITYVNLSYNHIGDEGMKILISKCKATNLQHLDLIACDVTWKGVAIICENFKCLNLKSLRLASNPLGGLSEISCCNFENLTNLNYLDLSNSGQTLESVAYLNDAILGKLDAESSLEVLDYSGIVPCSSIYQTNSAQLADQLGQTLAVNSSLLELHLQKNQLQSDSIEQILYGLKKHKNLLSLDLGYNKIGDYGIEHLAEWFKSKPRLIALNVTGNSVGDSGAKILSKYLQHSNIKYLNVSYNLIRNDGIVSLFNCFVKNNINMFFFWGNQFSHRANKVLANALKQGYLNQNEIDVKLYQVDKILCHTYYPNPDFNHRSFNVLNYNYPPFLKSETKHLPLRCNQSSIKTNLKSRMSIKKIS